MIRFYPNFTRDLQKTYLDAPSFMKRHYLRFFFEKFIVKDKKIYQAVPTPIFLALQDNSQVIISSGLRSQVLLIITPDLASIIQAFQDLRYIGELRQRWNEIKKLQVGHQVTFA